MALQVKKDDSLVGAKLQAITDNAAVTNHIYDYGTVAYIPRGSYVVLTGDILYDGKWTNYCLTTSGWYVILDTMEDTGKNWQIITGDTTKIVKYSQTQAQALVDKIISCNKQIIANNLLCARYANKFTEEQRQQIRDLQTRLQARNQSLIQDGYMKEDSIQTGYPEGYAELAPYMDKLMAGEEAVGVATWVIVVVACVVVASLSTAAYYAYRYMASEAEKDVKFSKELTAVLAQKLTPEEYQMLLNETKGIVTKSRIKQAISTGGMTWIAAAMLVGGLLIYTKFIKRQ